MKDVASGGQWCREACAAGLQWKGGSISGATRAVASVCFNIVQCVLAAKDRELGEDERVKADRATKRVAVTDATYCQRV